MFTWHLLKVYKPTCKLHSSETSVFCLPSVCTWSEIFFLCYTLTQSVCYSLPRKVRFQRFGRYECVNLNQFEPCKVKLSNTLTSSKSLKSHLFKLSCWLCVWCTCMSSVCVYVCVSPVSVYVCVCGGVSMCLCVFACTHRNFCWLCFGYLHCNRLCGPVWRNSTCIEEHIINIIIITLCAGPPFQWGVKEARDHCPDWQSWWSLG